MTENFILDCYCGKTPVLRVIRFGRFDVEIGKYYNVECTCGMRGKSYSTLNMSETDCELESIRFWNRLINLWKE